MATANRFSPTAEDPLGLNVDHTAFMAHKEDVRRALDLVQKIIDNDPNAPRPGHALWHNETFQDAVCHELRHMKSLQCDSEHLRIVKSVFGGRT